MKFTYITGALLAALAAARPTTNEDKFAVDYTSGNVTGEAALEPVSSISARDLQKRQNAQFALYDSNSAYLLYTSPKSDSICDLETNG